MNIASFRMVDEKEGETFPFPDSVDPNLKKRLSEAGIDGLYSHQAEGIAHIGQGKNIIVTTPTGSGKTLVYNIPVISRIMEKKGSRALYIFPTKASLRTSSDNMNSQILRGDMTAYPEMQKKDKEFRPDIILTNPEMLHLGILPSINTERLSSWLDLSSLTRPTLQGNSVPTWPTLQGG